MIQVIERFDKILQYYRRQPDRTCQLGELAELLGVSSPACSHIVKTMVELGYLRSLGTRRGYTLGPAIYLMGQANPYRHLENIARPVMEDLAFKHNKLVVLVVENGGRRMELLCLNRESSISVTTTSTQSNFHSLFGYSTGILLLSYMDEKQVKYFWDRDNGAANALKTADFAEFRRRSAEVARAGKMISINSMGAAVRSHGSVIACLGITFDSEFHDIAVEECCQAAARISELL